MVGAAIAAAEGFVPGWPTLAALAGAVLIQIGTNLVNDYADYETGADGPDRLGPRRATAQGWLSAGAVRRGAAIALGAAACVGVYIVSIGGWPMLIVGILSLISAVAYTAGPWPLAYLGLGDLFVFVFFGLVAVGGTYYLEASSLSPGALLGGAAIGTIGTAILVVNNLRDRVTDAQVGKRTLAVRLGARFSRIEYGLLISSAYGCVVYGVAMGTFSSAALAVLLTLPLALSESFGVWQKDGADLNAHLGGTARLELIFGLTLSLGVLL